MLGVFGVLFVTGYQEFAAKLKPDGSADSWYPVANSFIYTLYPDNDHNFYLGGAFTSIGGKVRNRIAKINADGTVDDTWNPDANG